MKPSLVKPSFSLAALLTAVAALAFSTPAQAQTFQTYLNGAQEPTSSLATGIGTVQLAAGGPTGERLFVTESISGLTSGLAAFHIHGPAAPGLDGPVLYNIASASMDPLGLLGKTSFSFTNFEIDLPSTVTASNGSVFTQAQQVTFLTTGVDYLNVHTANFPGGEIRGQIPSAPVPEVSTMASFGLLLALGLGALVIVAKRRKAGSLEA